MVGGIDLLLLLLLLLLAIGHVLLHGVELALVVVMVVLVSEVVVVWSIWRMLNGCSGGGSSSSGSRSCGHWVHDNSVAVHVVVVGGRGSRLSVVRVWRIVLLVLVLLLLVVVVVVDGSRGQGGGGRGRRERGRRRGRAGDELVRRRHLLLLGLIARRCFRLDVERRVALLGRVVAG